MQAVLEKVAAFDDRLRKYKRKKLFKVILILLEVKVLFEIFNKRFLVSDIFRGSNKYKFPGKLKSFNLFIILSLFIRELTFTMNR